ncbi:MAG: acetyl-CoA carboxylase biotin carboxyl carrier protein subunit, partial [Oscillospiraceae bacterium]
MKRFNITVNGQAYDVTVDEVGGAAPAPMAAPAPVAAPVAPVAAPAAAPAPAAIPANGTKIEAPMPGNILDVVVKPGDVVKDGQKL